MIYDRTLYRDGSSYYLTIGYNYNNKNEQFVVDVYISSKIGNPKFDVVIALAKGNKKFIAKVDTFRSVPKKEQETAVKVFDLKRKEYIYYNIELDKVLIRFLISGIEKTYTKALTTMSTQEVIQRLIWSEEKINLHKKKEVYIRINQVVYFNLGKNIGKEFEKIRPCIIWKKMNDNSLIIPLTSTENNLATIEFGSKKSYLNIKGIRVISNRRIIKKTKKKLTQEEIKKINDILKKEIIQ